MRLRKRIERSALVTGALGGTAAGWARLAHVTTRWETRGEAEAAAALARGPVVLAFWHEMLTLPAVAWRPAWGPLTAVHGARFAGRVVGALHERLGLAAFPMESRASNLAASREVLRLIRGGASVGLAADGPQGPRRVLKDAPLDWARASGRPVVAFAFAQRGAPRLPSWDRMVWPLPFARGALVWRLWREALPRRAEAAEMAALKSDLSATLDAVAAEAEAMVHR